MKKLRFSGLRLPDFWELLWNWIVFEAAFSLTISSRKLNPRGQSGQTIGSLNSWGVYCILKWQWFKKSFLYCRLWFCVRFASESKSPSLFNSWRKHRPFLSRQWRFGQAERSSSCATMEFSLSVGNFERMRVTENEIEILYHSFKCFVHLERLFEKVELV